MNINISDKLRQFKNLSDKEELNKIADLNHLSNDRTAQIKNYNFVTPMHIVIICLPVQQHFLKNPSILKAIRGK